MQFSGRKNARGQRLTWLIRRVGLGARPFLGGELSTNIGQLITRRWCVMRPGGPGSRHTPVTPLYTWIWNTSRDSEGDCRQGVHATLMAGK